METKKTSKKSVKIAETPVAISAVNEKSKTDSKPAKRTTEVKAPAKAPAAKAAVPTNSSHRHSKLSTPPSASISYDEVARLAYKYWEERSYTHGSAEEDWHRAEKTIRTRIA